MNQAFKDHSNSADVIRLLPVIMFTSVIFLIVGLHAYTMPLSQFSFMAAKDDTVIYDFFSFYKSVAIILSAVMAASL